MTFSQAFAQARRARREGKKTFSWNGSTYTTQAQSEVKVPVKVQGGDGKTIYVGVRGLTKQQAQARLQRFQKANPGKRIVMDQSMDPNSGQDRATAKKQLESRGKSLSNKHNAQVTVTAPRKNITSKTSGYVPVQDEKIQKKYNGRAYQNMSTGEINVTSNKGEILGKTYSTERAKNGDFDHYNYQSEKQLNRNVAGDRAAAEVNANSARVGNKNVTKEELEGNIRKGRSDIYNLANGLANSPNQLVSGTVRLVTDPNYTTRDYLQGYMDARKMTIGAGDLLQVENPELRAGLNFVNPMSIALSAGTYRPGEVQFEQRTVGTPGRATIKVQNTGRGRVQFSSGSAPTNPRVRLDGRGYGTTYHATGRSNHVYAPGSTTQVVEIPATQMAIPKYQLPSVGVMPVNFGRENVVVPEEQVQYVVSAPQVDYIPATPWQRQWYTSGEMPKTNWQGGSGDKTDRETVYATTDRVWPGLEGATRRTADSNLKGGMEGNGYFYVRQ